MSNEIQAFNFQITSLDQAMNYAKMIADSDLAPKDYKGKAGNVLIAMQFGSEIGLKPLQAIQNIAVINGRPSLWGDAMIALVQSHPLCEYIEERIENNVAYCTVKRRGDEKPYTYEFSKEDAKLAGLLGKAGPWAMYPDRMMQMRARAFALRDKFSDVLKGIAMREEVRDYVIDTTPEDNKKNSSEILDGLLMAKDQPRVCFEDVHCMISDASNMEDLDIAATFAKHLTDAEKNECRILYKAKLASFVNTITGEINQHDVQKEISHS